MANISEKLSKKIVQVRDEIIEARNMLYEMREAEQPKAVNAPADGGPPIAPVEDAEYIQPRTPEEDCANAQVILQAAQDLVNSVCPPGP